MWVIYSAGFAIAVRLLALMKLLFEQKSAGEIGCKIRVLTGLLGI